MGVVSAIGEGPQRSAVRQAIQESNRARLREPNRCACQQLRECRKADNYGIELELRKSLDFVTPGLAPFAVFANTTLMQSRITPGNTDISSLTSTDRAMVGQAEYVVNGGVTYAGAGGINATALYNVVGPRIVEAGALPFPDAYEQARHVVDLSLQLPVFRSTSLKLDARNLLDSPYRVLQGGVTRLEYKAGRVFSLGASWQP